MARSFRKNLHILAHRWLIRFGIDTRKLRQDRVVLERTIFRELVRDSSFHDILFVGCDWYTLHYPQMFPSKRFVTLEMSPELAEFGAKEHVVDRCENISLHFPPSSFDCIILNGVFGFGLNEMADINQTFHAIHQTLRPGGLFILGWNDQPNSKPCELDAIAELKKFAPCEFAGIGPIHDSQAKNRHRFHFYRSK